MERSNLFAICYAWLRCTKAVIPARCVIYRLSVCPDQFFIQTNIYFHSICKLHGLPKRLSGLFHCTTTDISKSLAKVSNVSEEEVRIVNFPLLYLICFSFVLDSLYLFSVVRRLRGFQWYFPGTVVSSSTDCCPIIIQLRMT